MYKLIAIDLSKQQALDADPKPIQQIKFTGTLERAGNTILFFILEQLKKTFCFLQEIARVLQIFFDLIQYQYKNDSIQQCEYKIIFFTT